MRRATGRTPSAQRPSRSCTPEATRTGRANCSTPWEGWPSLPRGSAWGVACSSLSSVAHPTPALQAPRCNLAPYKFPDHALLQPCCRRCRSTYASLTHLRPNPSPGALLCASFVVEFIRLNVGGFVERAFLAIGGKVRHRPRFAAGERSASDLYGRDSVPRRAPPARSAGVATPYRDTARTGAGPFTRALRAALCAADARQRGRQVHHHVLLPGCAPPAPFRAPRAPRCRPSRPWRPRLRTPCSFSALRPGTRQLQT